MNSQIIQSASLFAITPFDGDLEVLDLCSEFDSDSGALERVATVNYRAENFQVLDMKDFEIMGTEDVFLRYNGARIPGKILAIREKKNH